MSEPVELSGGRLSRPVRRGDVVERTAGPAAENVHALLEHFQRTGFDLAPRYLGRTAEGREVLSFVEGSVGYPPLDEAVRSEEALVDVARAIRAAHDAAAGFVPPQPDVWAPLEVATAVTVDCLGHRDLAPWNIVFDGTQVRAIIDWDTAGPTSRAWDLAYTAVQFVPFHAPPLDAWGWPGEPDRAHRLRLLCEAYGEEVSPAELIDLAIVRLTAIAAHLEERGRADDPAFAVHREEGHAAGYRSAAAYVISQREAWLT